MMMMVLVSKQHEVTTKYKMQATPHFSLICQSGEDIIQKCRASRFWGLLMLCLLFKTVQRYYKGYSKREKLFVDRGIG